MKRNSLSSEIGNLMKNGKKEEAEKIKIQVQEINNKLAENEKIEEEYSSQIKERMMKIPNIIHESVPIGEDDSKNVEIEKFGDPFVPDYEIPFIVSWILFLFKSTLITCTSIISPTLTTSSGCLM